MPSCGRCHQSEEQGANELFHVDLALSICFSGRMTSTAYMTSCESVGWKEGGKSLILPEVRWYLCAVPLNAGPHGYSLGHRGVRSFYLFLSHLCGYPVHLFEGQLEEGANES